MNDILQCLDESEYESETEKDPFEENGTDDEYRPNNEREESSSSSSSGCEEEVSLEDDNEVPNDSPVPRGRRGTRGRPRGLRGCSRRRNVSTRGRSGGGSRSRGRGLVRHENNVVSSNESPEREWNTKEFAPTPPQLNAPSYLPIDTTDYDYSQYFSQYIDDDLIALISNKTNQSYVLRTGKTLNFYEKECKTFIGITMIMSCINYPYIRMYWENKWRIPSVADSMPRNRYFLLRTALKVVFDPDVTQEQRNQDKLWKVRPLIERVLQGCHKQIRHQHICIDEMIIPFSGNCGIRQYCPNKPNPVGLKAFVLANPNGMVCDFTVYQGSTTFPEESAAGFGLGESAVLHMTRTLVPGHIIYFDRYFTSLKLVQELSTRGIKCSGTIMKNRIPAALKEVLPDDKDMKCSGRGSTSVFVNSDDSVAVTKWFDNKPVILMSTIYGSEPKDQCRRWCKRQKEYVNVERPLVVKMYNTNMGGVDLADRMMAVCPSRSRTKKWTICFISHMLDLSASNAWIQFRNDKLNQQIPLKKIQSLRQWKMQLAENIIEENTYYEDVLEEEDNSEPKTRKRGRPAIIPIPSKIRRQQGALHMPVFEGTINRCRLPGCKNRTTAKCSTCMVALCLTSTRNCYKAFHE